MYLKEKRKIFFEILIYWLQFIEPCACNGCMNFNREKEKCNSKILKLWSKESHFHFKKTNKRYV